jgi:predicted PurR-regulated permease PerM
MERNGSTVTDAGDVSRPVCDVDGRRAVVEHEPKDNSGAAADPAEPLLNSHRNLGEVPAVAGHSGAPGAGAPSRRPVTDADLHAVQRLTVRVLLIVSIWVVLVWVIVLARHFLFLLLLAWLTAIAAEPAIRWLTRRRWRRGLATTAVGVIVLLVALGTATLFGTLLFGQAAQLVRGAPTIVQSTVDQLNSSLGLSMNAPEIVAKFQLNTDRIQSLVNEWGGGVLGAVESLGSVLLDLTTVIVFALYMAAAGPNLVRKMAVWLPPERQRVFSELWEISTEKTGGYVASRVILSALSTAFHAVFFWAIGLPGWLPLAVLAGITAQFVPIIGTYIGIVVPGIVALADRPINALLIVLFAVVYQQIETYVFTPRVSQRTMDVNPAIALAAVFVGVAIWGPIGAVIGVPITAVVTAMVDTYGQQHALVPELADPGRAGADDEPSSPTASTPRDRAARPSRRWWQSGHRRTGSR